MATIRSQAIYLFLLSLCFGQTSLPMPQNLASSSSVNSSSKAGLAWSNGNWVDYTQYTYTDKVSWYYTWSPSPIKADIEFVPMLWGLNQVDQFASTINNTIANNKVTAVLGMNEPQQPGQSNLTAQQGVDLWKAYLEPLKSQGIRLGTPAPSSAPSGKAWLQQFFSICGDGCNPDFVALHWYDVNATVFQNYVEDFHNTFGLPIWVTEWDCQNFNNGPQCSVGEVVQFLNQTQSFLDVTNWVERYSWFGVMEDLQGVNPDNAMMTSSGKINALGEQYIGAQPGEGPPTSCAATVAQPKSSFLAISALAVVSILMMSGSLLQYFTDS